MEQKGVRIVSSVEEISFIVDDYNNNEIRQYGDVEFFQPVDAVVPLHDVPVLVPSSSPLLLLGLLFDEFGPIGRVLLVLFGLASCSYVAPTLLPKRNVYGN